MKCLFLDLASHDALIAAVEDDAVKASQSTHARVGDHELIPLIEKTLKSAGWSYADLDRVACAIGPGGFTSLRVGVTCANTLADQLSIPSVGIHLSDLYEARAWGVGRGAWGDIYWVHSTKKDQLFIRGGEYKEPTLISLDDLLPTPNAQFPIQWMGELIDDHKAKVSTDAIDLKSITEALPALLAAQIFDKELLEPWYGRGW
jgi:tRNA threonylcarbamoyl adenosine modification protein YeaZ